MIEAILAFVPAIAFGLCSLAADTVAFSGRDTLGLATILPVPQVYGTWLAVELVSVALFLVAIGLARANRAVFLLALATLGIGAAWQVQTPGHLVGAVVAVVLAGWLLGTYRRYDVRPTYNQGSIAAILLGVAGILVLVNGFLASLAVDAALVLLLTPGHDRRGADELSSARTALQRVGRGPLLPYQLGPLASPVANRAGTAAFAFAVAGRQAVVLGDPAGETEAAHRAFDDWVRECHGRDWQPVIYQATPGFTNLLVAEGWHAIRVGDEAVLDPSAFELGRSRVANLRHTITRSRKGGLVTVCSTNGLAGLPAGVDSASLATVDTEWRRSAGPALGFTVGRFEPETLAGCTIAVAIDAERRAQAFVVLRPTGEGAWMLDVMRRCRGGVPGALEACLVAAIDALGKAGVRRLSLGLAPLSGLSPSSGPIEERVLAGVARVLRPVYDVRGLWFFKDKLAPTWEPRYLVVQHRWGFGGAAVALLRLHLGGSWVRVARSVIEPAMAARNPPASRFGQTPAGSA